MRRRQHALASCGLDIRATTPARRLIECVVVLTTCALLAGATAVLAHAQSAARETEAERALAPNELHVMVWTATLPDHPTLLLVQTIHHLADDDPRIDVALGALADRVQAIVLEAPLHPPPARATAILLRYGVYPTNDNITNHVSGMTPERRAQCARQSGRNVFTFFQLKPWLAALAAAYRPKAPDAAEPGGKLPQMLGYRGIDQRLSSIGQKDAAHLSGNGRTGFQDVQRGAAHGAGSDVDSLCENLAGVRVPGTADLRALETAWISGDAALLDRLLTTRDPNESDALYTADHYIFRTNTDVFAAALARYDYFHGKGPILVAVGAGHFFGAASLLDRLRAVGYTVIPLQYALAAWQHASGTNSLGRSAVAHIGVLSPSATNHQATLTAGIAHRF